MNAGPPLLARPAPRLLSWLDDVGYGAANHDTHPERDLIEACGEAADFVDKDEAARGLVDAQGGDEAVVDAARASSEAVRTASQRIASLPARTPEGLAAKATVLDEAVFREGIGITAVLDHEDLLKSILDDARFIGNRGRFTISRLVGMEMDAPVRAPDEGWTFRHLMHDWANSTIDEQELYEIVERIDDLHPEPERSPALMVQEGDSELFAVRPVDGHLTQDGRPFYDGASIGKLYSLLSSDHPMSSFEHGQRRRARIRGIVDAHRDREVAIERIARDSGLAAAKAAMQWETSRQSTLRMQIIATPVHTLDGLLAKALVFSDCRGNSPGEAFADVEADLLEKVSSGRTSDVAMADSLLLDLLRICVRRRMSVTEMAGCSQRPSKAPAAAATKAA